MSTKSIPPPGFKGKSYEQYRVELGAWESITEVAKKKQAVTVAFSLPEEHETRIREKVFTELTIEELNVDEGLKKLTDFLDKKLKPDDIADSWYKFNDFDECKRESDQSVNDFIVKFDQKYQKVVKRGITLPSEIVAFMLLKRSNLTKEERQLVLTGMDYSKKTELYEQAQKSLQKFKGDQVCAGVSAYDSSPAIKLEPAFVVEDYNEEAYFASGHQRTNNRGTSFQYRGRGSHRGNGRGGRSNMNHNDETEHYNNNNNNDNSNNNNTNYRNNNRGGRGGRRSGRGGAPRVNRGTRRVNPIGSNGNILTCAACGSFRHLLAECPDSWENLEEACVCEALNESEEIGDSETISDSEADVDVILYTGDKKDRIAELGKESQNCIVLDSACTRNVCGHHWLDCYLAALDDTNKEKVKVEPGVKRYKFGGGEILRSEKCVHIPAEVAGKKIMIECDVVDSQIPLLWSLEDMKKAKVKLDLANDVAEIYGNLVNLNYTSSGHYCLPIIPTEMPAEDVNAVELAELKPKDIQHPSMTSYLSKPSEYR